MNCKFLTRVVLGTATISLIILGGIGPARAGCGLIGCVVNSVLPGVGTLGDDAVRGIRQRSSSESVFNHVVGGLGQYDVPIGRPAQPTGSSTPPPAAGQLPPPLIVGEPTMVPAQGNPMWGNFCATPAGVFGPGPVNPVGAGCNAQTPYGMVFGQVTRL